MSYFFFWHRECLRPDLSSLCDDILGIISAFCETEIYFFDYRTLTNSYDIHILKSSGLFKTCAQVRTLTYQSFSSACQTADGNTYVVAKNWAQDNCVCEFQSEKIQFDDKFDFTQLFHRVQLLPKKEEQLFEHHGNLYVYSPQPAHSQLQFSLITNGTNNNNVTNNNNLEISKSEFVILSEYSKSFFSKLSCNEVLSGLLNRRLISCNGRLYLTGGKTNLLNKMDKIIISQLKIDFKRGLANAIRTFYYCIELVDTTLIQIVQTQARKIIYLSEQSIYFFDCIKNQWEPHKNHNNFIRFDIYNNYDGFVAPFNENIVFFPFWNCDCKKPSKCNYYDISLREWFLCPSALYGRNNQNHFLFLNK